MIHLTDKTLTEPISVVGFQIRTSNPFELSGSGQIGALWSRLFSENVADRIANRASESIFVVYSNYASDENGEYDYMLGYPVESLERVPDGMVKTSIAVGDYAVFTSETGPVVEVVQAAWKHIWNLEPGELGRLRSFNTDYEVYDHRAANPASAQVEIHLGLEPAS